MLATPKLKIKGTRLNITSNFKKMLIYVICEKFGSFMSLRLKKGLIYPSIFLTPILQDCLNTFKLEF